MSCTLTVDGPCRRTLRFSIDRATVEAQVQSGLRELAGRANFKGFRPGKVPLEVVRKTHGKSVAEDVRRTLMSQAFREAVSEHKLQPIGEPVLNLQQLQDEPGAPFSFSLEIEVVPEFELGQLAGLPVTVELPVVDVGLVESEVERLRRQAGSLQDAPDGEPVGPDSVLAATLTYTVEGSALAPRGDRPVLPKHDILDGFRAPGSGAAFLGRKLGDEVQLQVELPPHFDPAALAGKPAAVAARIDLHRLAVPAALDEAFFQRVGVSGLDELRQRVGEGLQAQRAQLRDSLVDRAIEKKLIELHPFELPERLVSKAIERRVHEIAHQLM
ncbi:MAG TPA: trigger factor, partial [Planctomycetota bacterium]|nr:trigger factor [Planctomycetota bacterium]